MSAFDKHRVGKHEHDRRCLPVGEFAGIGLKQDTRGRWALAAQAERVRRHFARTRTPLRAQGSDGDASDGREATPYDPEISEAAAAVSPIERSEAA